LAVPQVEYLGHIISGKGVAIDPLKIVAIKSWRIPSPATQLRGFLGLTGYYKRFVHNYGIMCKPLHAMLKKDSFSWHLDQTAAFNNLKAI
jgi:hypothetical protein